MNRTKDLFMAFLVCEFLFLAACNRKTNVSVENVSLSDEDISLSEEDVNLDLIKCLDNKEYDKALLIIKNNDIDGNFIYNDKPLLSYCVSNDITDLSLELLEHTDDISNIDKKIETPLFETVLKKKNTVLEKVLLQKGIDLSYRNVNTGNASYLSMCMALPENSIKEEIIDILFKFDYVKDYYLKDKSTLITIVWNWTENSPKYIEMIYGEDFNVPDDIPILHNCINKLDAIIFFVEKGADINKEFFVENPDFFGTPLDYAIYLKALLDRPNLDGSPIDSDEYDEKKANMNQIIEYLKEKMDKASGTIIRDTEIF